MTRRIELRGIANALNESFISRNNDFRGYWAIGQLKLFAIDNGLSAVEFSLTLTKSNSRFSLENYIVRHYANMLGELLRKQKIPEVWVRVVSITIDFNVNAKEVQLHEYPASGEPFQCCCQIIDDAGRRYCSIIYGRCQPHSAAKELKSGRSSPCK